MRCQVTSLVIDVGKEQDKLASHIENVELVISLVPQPFHPVVAKLCIKKKKNMVTASYVSPELESLDAAAKNAGILLLSEMGVDPGIDHMSALKMIAEARQEGGEIEGFASLCGGLPAPEAATNQLGYKFSWSPKGVLTASKNPARFLVHGKHVKVAPKDLLKSS